VAPICTHDVYRTSNWEPLTLAAPLSKVHSKEHTMAESTITAKGQTTVPADIRALVHAKPGTRLVWSAMSDGTIIVRAKTKSILDMAGMLKAPKGKRVSVDDMNPWR
jgi:AbrB family looped-hinge helix DNA binding protein